MTTVRASWSRGRRRAALFLCALGVMGCAALAAPACSATGGVNATQGTVGGGSSSGASTGGAPTTGVGFGAQSASSTGPGMTTTATTTGSGGGTAGHCGAGSTDLTECPCDQAGATEACYPATASPTTRNVGACKDGTQTCQGAGELLTWGPCTGAVTPTAENCTDGMDHDCNGKTGCADPSCASNPACSTGCQNGQTRSCYTGPAGTENVGSCKDGTQTCNNGVWSTGCPGEVLPTQEVCADFFGDHNCNGLPGCFDIFACFNDPACQPPPCMPANGCTCPMGFGDAALCPNGTYGDALSGQCCPCSASTCDQLGCCGEPECANVGQCAELICSDNLPASCMGMVNSDCDWEDLDTATASDPPEDCDQTCCKCKPPLCP